MNEHDVSATGAARNGWWRRNALWLLGALLLGAWAMIVPYREALDEYEKMRPSHPIDVAPGQWAEYAGARWRVLGVDTLAAGGPLSGQRPDATVLAVRFEVVPGRATLAKQLDSCQGRLSDDRQRRWQHTSSLLDRNRYPQPRSCGSDYADDQVRALPGRPFRFVHAYQVPREQAQVLQGLRAEIVMPLAKQTPDDMPPGTYLRFAL